MNRRDFLTSSLRGLILGAAISSGLAKTAIALPDPKFTEIKDTFVYRTWISDEMKSRMIKEMGQQWWDGFISKVKIVHGVL